MIRGMTDQTIIQLSKRRLILLLVGSCAFVVGGIWMSRAEVDPRDPMAFFRYPPVVHGTGLACIAFFGLTGAVSFWKLFDKRPGLVLNAEGLIDNSSGSAAGPVPWSDIAGFEVVQIFGQKLLIVKMVDPNRYAEIGSPPIRTLRRMNLKLCGSPIALSSNALRIDFAELVGVCNSKVSRERPWSRSED